MHDVVAVAKDLDLDMAGAGDHLFQIEPAVAEGGQRLGRCLGKLCLQLDRIVDDADATTTAAGCRLDHHGKAGALGHLMCIGKAGDTAVAAGNGRHAGLLGNGTGGDLVTQKADRIA